MKKTILLFLIVISLYVFIGNVFATKNIIPDEAIRIRVIANSNSEYDQNIKLKVKDSIEYDIYNLLKNTESISEARVKINDNLDKLDYNINNLLKKENYEFTANINYGLNYFPEKEFKGIKYDEGYYESVVVTIGEGLGDNWWCVLFPPLCTLEATESTDIEYTTMAKAMIDKYF